MFRWLFTREEAERRPGKTVIAMSVQGFILGGLFGYFRFGDSVGTGLR